MLPEQESGVARCPASHAKTILCSQTIKQIHLVKWLSSLNQLQTNFILLSTLRWFLSFFIFCWKCKRNRWYLTMDRVVRFCPNIHVWAGSFFMTLACISMSKYNTSCISPQWQKNYPSGAQLSFPRKFLVLKIVGKAQECDLSVTGHLIVDKPFRWLIPCCVLGCFEALPVCTLTLLAASPQPLQMLSSRHIQVCILLTRLC